MSYTEIVDSTSGMQAPDEFERSKRRLFDRVLNFQIRSSLEACEMIAILAGSVVAFSTLGWMGLDADTCNDDRIGVDSISSRVGSQQDTETQSEPGGADNALGSAPLAGDSNVTFLARKPPPTVIGLQLPAPTARRPFVFQFGDIGFVDVSFGVSGQPATLSFERGSDLTPRAQKLWVSRQLSSPGGDGKTEESLTDRDQRHTNVKAPEWFFFIGADNEALVFNVADTKSVRGLVLRDQVTIGDVQVGLTWSTDFGIQTSFGLVERKLAFDDITGDRDVSVRERFAAVSFSMKS